VDIIEVDGNQLARFTAGSPATLMQSFITDSEPFELSFDYMFLQPEGSLDVFLGSDLLLSLDGSSLFNNDFSQYKLTLDDPNFWGRQDSLNFTYNGPTGSQFYLDNVSVGSVSAVPEPSSVILLATGAGLLALRRRRRTKQVVDAQ
jgi:hypothetical protein